MEYVVQMTFYKGIVRDIVLDVSKIVYAKQMRYVGKITCDQVVHGNDFIAFAQETITEMRAEKPGSPCD